MECITVDEMVDKLMTEFKLAALVTESSDVIKIVDKMKKKLCKLKIMCSNNWPHQWNGTDPQAQLLFM